LKLNTSES